MVFLSARADKELKRMGCYGPNFLRLAKPKGKDKCFFFIDSNMGRSDEIIRDGEVRVVTDHKNIPFANGLYIDIDSLGLKVS